MACDFEIRYHATDGLEATDAALHALDLIEQLEDQLSIYRKQSEISQINRSAGTSWVAVESQLFTLLRHCRQLDEQTGGAFDVTSSPLSRIWGFLRREGRLPQTDEIEDARRLVGRDRWELDDETSAIRFEAEGVEINLNSIGKGYALDRAAEVLQQRGISDFLWHGGRSSVLARGRNQADSREVWTVGIGHPLVPGQRSAEIYLRNQAMGTAGSGTQFFEHEGRRYGHVIDPRTGWPASDVYTATAITASAADADALATAFYVMGPAGAAEYCHEHDETSAVLVCPAAPKPKSKCMRSICPTTSG